MRPTKLRLTNKFSTRNDLYYFIYVFLYRKVNFKYFHVMLAHAFQFSFHHGETQLSARQILLTHTPLFFVCIHILFKQTFQVCHNNLYQKSTLSGGCLRFSFTQYRFFQIWARMLYKRRRKQAKSCVCLEASAISKSVGECVVLARRFFRHYCFHRPLKFKLRH